MLERLKKWFTLKNVLIAFVSLSVTLTVSLLLMVSYQSEKRTLVNTVLTLNDSKSDKMSKSVDLLFQSMRSSLRETTNFLSNNLQEMSDEEIQEQIELLRKNSRYFNSLTWIDETSLVRSIAPISVGLKGEKITGVTKEVLELKQPNLTTPYIAPTGRILILLSEPLYDTHGEYRGLIGGTIYLQQKNVLNEILGNDVIDDFGSFYYVVGPEGKLLFHPDVDRVGEDVTANPIVRKIMEGESGMQRVVNTKGTPMFAAYNYIPETGWGVVQQTPASHINELLYKRIKERVMYIFPPFLIVLLLCIFVAHKLAKPFHSLAELVDRLGSGETMEVPKVRSNLIREVNLLTESVLIAMKSVQANNKKLTEEAMTDPLTKLPNRRKLTLTIERLKEQDRSFSLVLFDIDHFKSVNDQHGHDAGDEVLKDLSSTAQSLIRKSDRLFRYGGEEFVIILPDTNSSEAYHVAEKIRTTFEQKISPIGKRITTSLGISEFPFHTDSVEELFVFADRSLYQSKSEGRNRTTIWCEERL